MGLLTDALTGGLTKAARDVSGSGNDKGSSNSGGALSRVISDVRKKKGRATGDSDSTDVPAYHRGGKVRKTGLARLKKGERVLTKGQQKAIKKRMKKRRGGKKR